MQQRRSISNGGGLSHDSAASPTKAPFEILERNWRRVASTHTLQDLLDADKPRQEPRQPNFKLLALGVLLILGGVATLALGVFAFVVAPLLPPLSHPWLAAVQEDRYYRLLVPLTVPVTIAAITLNWFSMKLFKHNS
ncbi:hypothetical protein COHA_009537 [Chlorella ohadii]|uniref:Transmembrane protein n=1 Tax=Chlorella ohadii TaxID=2649997 RepID=A0AAD5DHY2_9CHLO|nr:hypothetical protein COHA_009537 [Chlorella ohadii]